MYARRVGSFAALAIFVASLTAGPAGAGQGMTCSMVNSHPQDPAGNGLFTLLKDGKFTIKPSNKAGDGGSFLSFALSSIDCPPNNTGNPGTCNSTNNVLDVFTDFSGVQTHIGILYDVIGGKSALKVNGSTKASGNQIFGPLALALSGNAIAIGIVKARGPATTPSDCATVPLEFKDGQKCNDGVVYGDCGIIGGNDPTPNQCTTDTQCSATQICTGGTCVGQTCAQDSACRSFSGPGSTVACNETTTTCCLVGVDPDPGCDID